MNPRTGRRSDRVALRRIVTAALLTAVGMIFSYIEAILPFSIGIPGVKLGLCHIVTLFALYRLTVWETAAVTAVRVTLTAILFGSVASLAYSAAGAAVSLVVMLAARRLHRRGVSLFSPIGLSILGGVTHNLAQLATAAAMMRTAGILTYLPVLIIAGTLTGAAIGVVGAMVVARSEV